MAASFALPPKVVERSWTQEERQKLYPNATLSTASAEVINPEPNFNGLFRYDRARDELVWVKADGNEALHWNARTRAAHTKALKGGERTLEAYRPDPGARLKTKRGSWELLKNVLYFIPDSSDGNPLWNLPVADDLVSLQVDRDRSTWMGLSTKPNKLYHLFWIPGSRRDEALLEVLKWDGAGELVAWQPCAEGKSLLTENTGTSAEPAVKLYALRANDKLRTLDVESVAEVKGYWATAVAPRTCGEVYLATAKGVLRVSR